MLSCIPLLLAVAYAVFTALGRPYEMLGWGDDPHFNLWTLEHVWERFRTVGITHVFAADFWQTPIFNGSPYSLAFSENQIASALLSWPLREFTGNGVLTMNIWAAVQIVAAYVCMTLWLCRLDYTRREAAWGGLLYAGCGWLQSQYAHYQNICIFVFPLALWSWARLREAPSCLWAVVCSFCFGWISAWNLYYQVLANIIFAFVFVRAWRYALVPRRYLLTVFFGVGGFEFPISWCYLRARDYVGGYDFSDRAVRGYRAGLSVFWEHTKRESLVQRLLPFYPRPSHGPTAIESSGYTGFTWVIALWAAWRLRLPRREKLLLAAAVAALWVSFGPDAGLYQLFKLMPGFMALRAVGRFHILFVLFSVPVILHFVFRQGSSRPWVLALVLLELFPGTAPLHTPIDPTFFTRESALNAWLRMHDPTRSLVVLPALTTSLQTYFLPTRAPLLDGYSGRAPKWIHEARQLAEDGNWAQLRAKFGVGRVLVAEEELGAWEPKLGSAFVPQGCFEQYESRRLCVYDLQE